MKWIGIAAVLACATLVSGQKPAHPILQLGPHGPPPGRPAPPAPTPQDDPKLVEKPGPARGVGVSVVPDQVVVSEKAPITDDDSGKEVFPVVEIVGKKAVTHFYTAYKVGVLPPKPTNRGPQRVNHEAALKNILDIK